MAEAHYNLGLTYYALGKTGDAASCFRQAIGFNAQYADAYNDLGIALQAQGDLPQALEHYSRAVELRPGFADAHWNRSLAWLLAGDFEKGWSEYEWRWRRKESPARTLAGPRWDGTPVDGKRIFIYAEQGLGDAIQFVRYLPLVKERGAFVVFECQPELFNLLQSCKGIDQLIRRGDPLPAFDTHVPLLSLPGIFRTTLESIPCQVPYIRAADNANIDAAILPLNNAEQRVGIVWAGNASHTNDRNRSCPLAHFAALVNLPRIRLYSLQKGERAVDLKTHDFGQAVTDLGGLLDDFADTAAVVAKLDLVLTVDTSVAHVAGAMGKPVWVLLPFAPDWRWLRNREDSPWYPGMRLFRQPRPHAWEDVFRKVASALASDDHR
jgi:tetratricopeptide (TPR) repeat protein